jgi:hypothetical protein
MRSEAIGVLRAWNKERLGRQEQQLRTVERAVVRLDELDVERSRTLDDLQAAVDGLADAGLDEAQIAEFVGTDLAALRTAPGRRRAKRRPPSAPARLVTFETTGQGGES